MAWGSMGLHNRAYQKDGVIVGLRGCASAFSATGGSKTHMQRKRATQTG